MKTFKETPMAPQRRQHVNITNHKNKPLPSHRQYETPTTSARLRSKGLIARAHAIAIRLHQISEPYLNRDEAVPIDLLVAAFEQEIDNTDQLRGGPLTSLEIPLLATTLVPNALAEIRRTIETADKNLRRSFRFAEELSAA
jgi:hypothetical protein